jgi:hypothetical protein
MEMTGNHFLTTYRECPLQRHFRYQYAERKRLFPESPKTFPERTRITISNKNKRKTEVSMLSASTIFRIDFRTVVAVAF